MNPDNANNPIILFDGVCNLCNGTINFIIDHDPKAKFKFSALQSEAGKRILSAYNPDSPYNQSIVLVLYGKLFMKSRAVLEIVKRLNGIWKFLYVFIVIPSPVLNIFYDLVARYRYRIFGKRKTCRTPAPDLLSRFITE